MFRRRISRTQIVTKIDPLVLTSTLMRISGSHPPMITLMMTNLAERRKRKRKTRKREVKIGRRTVSRGSSATLTAKSGWPRG